MGKQKVVIGDVHGCIDELKELLKTIQYDSNQIDLYFAGDLMDRGPDSVACVRLVRELNAKMCKGNHEDTHVRFRKHAEKEQATGKSNPMASRPDVFKKLNKELSDEDVAWMKSLPLSIDLGNNLWLVHGGCEPRYSLKDQSANQIIRCRYVDQNGVAKALNPDKTQPKGTVYWAEAWNGPESIIYGHCVHSLQDIRVDERPNGVRCIGIDTGCVYGGMLTAYLVESREVVQVKARQEYMPLRKGENDG